MKQFFCRTRPDVPNSRQFRWIQILVGITALLVISFFLVRKISEYDIWYHMAVGQEILRLGKLPTTDQLSLLNLGQPFHAHLWLFQTIAAGGYKFAGFWWLQAMQICIWGLTLSVTYRATRVWASANTTWLLLLVTTIACSERFTIRPEIVSYCMIALFYWRLQQGKYRSLPDIAFLTALQWIWTNSHGLFPIGPFLVGCYLIVAAAKGKRDSYQEARSLAILSLAVTVACIFTPNGLENLKYAWLLVTEVSPISPELFFSIYELASPLGEISRKLSPFWFYFTLLAAVGISILALLRQRPQNMPFARILIVLAMFATSLSGMRNMPLFAIVAAPLIAENLSRLDSRRMRSLAAVAVVAIVLAATTVWSPKPAMIHLTTWVPYRFGIGMSADYTPLGLPAFLDRIGFSGPIFNSQNQGGFYEYHSSPRRIPFYDYRLEDYDPRELQKVYTAVRQAYEQPAGWHDLLRRYDFRGLLLVNQHGGAMESDGLLPLVATDPRWRLVFLDHAASFWIRTDYPQLPPAIDVNQITRLVAGTSNDFQAENLDYFLEKTLLFPDQRLTLLEQATRRDNNPLLLINLGLLKIQSGDLVAAESLFRRVLAIKPKSRLTLTTLAQLALQRGDKSAAEKFLRDALRYYPDDQEVRQNLATVLDSAGQ